MEREREREEGEGGEGLATGVVALAQSQKPWKRREGREGGMGTASDAGCEILVERHSFVLSLETFNSTGLTLVMGSLSY